MKVLTRTQFLALQGPVLYSKIPCHSTIPESTLCIKYDTVDGDDWYYKTFEGRDVQLDSETKHGEDMWTEDRKGNYRDDLKVDMEPRFLDEEFEGTEVKFVVYEADDIGEFMRKMNECFQTAVRFADAQYMVVRISPMTDVNANLKVTAKYRGVEKEFIYNRIYLNTLKEMIGQRYNGQSWVQVEKYGSGYELIVANPKSEDPIGELMDYLKHESRSRFQG